ncbi:hypothetical protein CVT26_002181 [Gymnopilus dilepis]|uniref:protein-serine/threonine phosphatase n=1 Tax=Gymnopilus dilepis TaxID=231916 RepID=A0A409VBG3_9AGAR|nr:hypothetical protein CVT26_002181 [Gymnopilus dilepis]
MTTTSIDAFNKANDNLNASSSDGLTNTNAEISPAPTLAASDTDTVTLAAATEAATEQAASGSAAISDTPAPDAPSAPSESSASSPDLTTESGVRAYLAKTAFASTDIEPLLGGTANYVYRLVLEREYEGRKTLVLKHAKPYVKSWKELKFAVERQIYEVAALKYVRAWLPKDSIVQVPAVHLFDQEEHVIIMDDAGADSLSLKAFMQQGRATVEIASQIGAAVGKFLGGLHRWGKGNKEACDAVKGNVEAKTMSAFAYYDRLRPTLDGTSTLEKLQDPPLKADDADLEIIDKIAQETKKALLEVDDQFVMGDFWPGNLMIQVEDGKLKQIIVLDWEMTKTGLAGLDVGQFSAEIHLLRRCQPEICGKEATALLDQFLVEYKKANEPGLDIVKHTLVQWGAHMAILGARVDWGGKELSRAVVMEGVRLLVDGYKGEIMGDSSPTELYLPQHLDYPIKVLSLDVSKNDHVQRGTRLLSYSFVYLPTASPDPKPETRFGTWDSAIEGTLKSWNIKVGDVISQKRARDKPVVTIIEPCKHGMQLGGLCVLCGKDMTNVDYTGFSDASRASIQMTHSAFGPTVSLEEAQRIERETAEHLLKSRKLSLIVDLDQTIVHATVDPTVGEWINEGEAWEARHAAKTASTSEGGTPPDDDDECNPNWEALKDVKRFRLGPESFGPPSLRGSQRNKGKNKMVETEGCMYYIKPRPGWKEFLRETATKYEMHVYTMGTRAYAEEVCAAIDPDGSIFGGRILSRDESGSLTQKSLQRLFPCDTSMVVIIDDRADVWEWSPNLIKVIPYDFFIGIGDINSSFLPKIEPLTPSVPTPPASPAQNINGAAPASPPLPSEEEQEKVEEETTAMLKENNAALDAQLEERPLAKKEKELQEHEVQEQQEQQPPQAEAAGTATTTPPPSNKEASPKPEKAHKKALLKNDDYELDRVSKLLNEVHSRFFSAYDARSPEHARRKTGPAAKAYDVTRIIPRLRSEVFEGVHILFSSVIPLDTVPETTDIWRMAHMFGARVSTELKSDITHVVAAKRGTVKVDMARKRGGIKIVWLAWFTDSIALWRRQDEKPYLLDDPPAQPSSMINVQTSSSPITESAQLIDSSDLDIDSDDWDQEPPDMTTTMGSTKEVGMLELEAINWDDINDEVEAAMNESDDEDYGSERGGAVMGGTASEDEGSDATGSANNTPRLKRKRLRSTTPSDGANGSTRDDDELLRSPLSKRKKLAADRSGYSRLKEGISAEQLAAEDDRASNGQRTPNGSAPASPRISGQETAFDAEDDSDEDDSDDEEEEEEDDFLARELEEEWG